MFTKSKLAQKENQSQDQRKKQIHFYSKTLSSTRKILKAAKAFTELVSDLEFAGCKANTEKFSFYTEAMYSEQIEWSIPQILISFTKVTK